MLDRQQSVADAVLDHSECAVVFQRHRIDYCCRGELTIEAAATAKGVATDALLLELEDAIVTRKGAPEEDLRSLPTPQLLAHIEVTHHAYLRRALPMVRTLAAKVGRVHGDRNPKLHALALRVAELETALLDHLDEEEGVLFPALRGDEALDAGIATELRAMMEDHLRVADLLEAIREASDDFAAPAWACTSYRTLLSELAHAERDVHVHVHLENHVLAPRFVDR